MIRSLTQRFQRFIPNYELDSGPGRVVPMEGLRGIAVLLVFFVHFHALFGMFLPGGTLLRRISEFLGTIGNCGVDLFFVMSGYLIYGAVITKQTRFSKFLFRRVQRIFPTFITVLLLYLGLSILFPDHSKLHGSVGHAAVYVFENALLLPGIFAILPIVAVAWSLSYEFCFYLILPMTVAVLKLRRWNPRQRLIAFVSAWVVTGAAIMTCQHTDRSRMISFLVGIVLFEAKALPDLAAWIKRKEWLVVLLLIGGLTFFYFIHAPRAHSAISPFAPVFGLTVAFFLLCLYTLNGAGATVTALSWSPIRYLGNMSYSYYLIHGLTLEGVAEVFGYMGLVKSSVITIIAGLLCGFAATWVTSTLLFCLVEKRYSLAAKGKKAMSIVNRSSIVPALATSYSTSESYATSAAERSR